MLAHEYLLSRWVHVENSDMQHVFVQIWKMSWLPDANSVLGAELVWFDCLMQVNISGSIYLLIIPKILKLLTWQYCCCSLNYSYPTPVFFWLISLRRPVVLCWLMLAYRRWQPREWSEGLRKNWAQEIACQTLQLAEALLLCGVDAMQKHLSMDEL